MATDDACPHDALRCARVVRPVVARVLCYPARSVVAATRVSADRGRDFVVIFMSHGHVSLPFRIENIKTPGDNAEIRADSLSLSSSGSNHHRRVSQAQIWKTGIWESIKLWDLRDSLSSTILSLEALESRDFVNLTPDFSFNFGTPDIASVSRYFGRHTSKIYFS